MLAIFQLVFSDFWHFAGMCILITCTADSAKAWLKIVVRK